MALAHPSPRQTGHVGDTVHLARITTTLRDVLPASLPLASIQIELDDVLDASARHHRGQNELVVGRPLLDALSDATAFTGYLAHEVGHLIDPGRHRTWIPYLGMCTVGLGALLFIAGVLPGPKILLVAAPIGLFGFLVAQLAVLRRSELRADRLAGELSSPEAIEAALLFIKAGPHIPSGPRLLWTHPAPEQRLARLRSEFPSLIDPDA